MSDEDDSTCLEAAPRRAGGRQPGRPNYQNNILIPIVKNILPSGTEGWRLVALAYQKESGEVNLHCEHDSKKNWTQKLCNKMMKLTGWTGADARDRINRCIKLRGRF